jgi:site-specific DNA-methyltransferase (adenine-specific)/adenine-specific DNA-methyltransferase
MAELTWLNKSPAKSQDCITNTCDTLITTETIYPSIEQSSSNHSSDQSWHNRLIHGDASRVLPALLPEFTGMIDLIYIDPPFMTGRDFKNGSHLAYSDKWGNSLDGYLSWLYEISLSLYKLLASDGSLYVHLDWRVVHYIKVLLDEIFGGSLTGDGPGFQNEIIWQYQSGGRSTRHYARKHDTILLYTKSANYCFHPERIGERRGAQKRNHMRKELDNEGQVHWTIKSDGRIYSYSEDSLMTPSDVWSDISHLHQKDPERAGYATQKPVALLERILLASSEVDDLILDCFCGSGVTPSVAQQLGRRWIACDSGELAIATTHARLVTQELMYPFVLQHLERPGNLGEHSS